MSASYNKQIGIGNLGKDPEITVFDNGGKVCKFSVATTEKYKTKAGDVKTLTTWFNIEVWMPSLVEVCEKYLAKGSRILFEGATRNETYEDKNGVTKYTSHVDMRVMVMLGNKPDATTANEHTPAEHEAINEGLPGDDDNMPF